MFTLARGKREQVAAQLDAGGFTHEQLRALWAYVSENAVATAQAEAKRIMAALVSDQARLAAALEDLRKMREAQLAAGPGRAKKWHPGEIDRMRTRLRLQDERRTWADLDREHYIRCRMADGAPRDVAEAEAAQR